LSRLIVSSRYRHPQRAGAGSATGPQHWAFSDGSQQIFASVVEQHAAACFGCVRLSDVSGDPCGFIVSFSFVAPLGFTRIDEANAERRMQNRSGNKPYDARAFTVRTNSNRSSVAATDDDSAISVRTTFPTHFNRTAVPLFPVGRVIMNSIGCPISTGTSD
jgi:hypothetical protein